MPISGNQGEGVLDEFNDVAGRTATTTAQTTANSALSAANAAQTTANSALALAQLSFQGFGIQTTTFSTSAPANGYATLTSVSSGSSKGGVCLVLAFGTWSNGTVAAVIPSLQMVDGNGALIGATISTFGSSNVQTGWAIVGSTTTGSATLRGKGNGSATNTINGFIALVSGA